MKLLRFHRARVGNHEAVTVVTEPAARLVQAVRAVTVGLPVDCRLESERVSISNSEVSVHLTVIGSAYIAAVGICLRSEIRWVGLLTLERAEVIDFLHHTFTPMGVAVALPPIVHWDVQRAGAAWGKP